MATGYVSEAAIRRLPAYYRQLRELEKAGVETISSKELGERLHQTPSQIRQDINTFGGIGRQGCGYQVKELKERIGEELGLNAEHRMVILGAGSIGTAVARYPTFQREGFRTLALFDSAPSKVGTAVDGIPVLDIADLETFLGEHPADIAVLALPAGAAQEALRRLEESGVNAVWNFAPADLQYESSRMEVVNVHLSDSLQVLTYKMAHR
ncbi:MAG: redox-sensing transcriptional repressor Rex [Clostridia bacterium]|nr:redox-sensing transcriptional repressor Rex [Clostridia bacterium]